MRPSMALNLAVASFEVIDESEKKIGVASAVIRSTAETRDVVQDALDSGLREHQVLSVGVLFFKPHFAASTHVRVSLLGFGGTP